jgi:hypothetical protein
VKFCIMLRHIAETKRKALEGGAEALLIKPIDFAILRNEIETRVDGAA